MLDENTHADGLQILTKLVQNARPDFVVLTGDILDGRGQWNSSTSFINEFEAISDAICGVQWAFTPGCHIFYWNVLDREALLVGVL